VWLGLPLERQGYVRIVVDVPDLKPGRASSYAVASHVGVMAILTIAFLSACATQVAAPDTPKIKTLKLKDILDQLPFKPTDLVPIRDYAARVDLPGVSVLPPRGRFEPWHMARWRMREAEGIAVFSQRKGDQALFAWVVSAASTERDWRLLRAAQPTVFAEAVRLTVFNSDLPFQL
jgi:hypothetical protein